VTVRQQWAVVALIVALVMGGVAVATRFGGHQHSPVTAGSRAPNFSALTVTTPRETKTLDDYRGDVVLLNIWATWCTPCRVEMPSIEALHRDFHDKGLRVVAVSVDDAVNANGVRQFAEDLGLTFEILHDSVSAIERSYQIYGYPATFVIGRDGIIRRRHMGADDWNSPANRELVSMLLGIRDDAEANDG
jgi:cytochrome c biogenesis protein CcmG, thiol:disulfide interchange protein DsbE